MSLIISINHHHYPHHHLISPSFSWRRWALWSFFAYLFSSICNSFLYFFLNLVRFLHLLLMAIKISSPVVYLSDKLRLKFYWQVKLIQYSYRPIYIYIFFLFSSFLYTVFYIFIYSMVAVYPFCSLLTHFLLQLLYRYTSFECFKFSYTDIK